MPLKGLLGLGGGVAGGGGVPFTATGGQTGSFTDGGVTWHKHSFPTSGTFVGEGGPVEGGKIVIIGGGGCGGVAGAGGGGGGSYEAANVEFEEGPYPGTIGAGGN